MESIQNQTRDDIIKTACEDPRTLDMFRYLINGSFLRVINYHNTSAVNIPRIRGELAMFKECFTSVSVADIDRVFETKAWPLDKPALIPAVYEGWRNHYDIMLPLLEEIGFRGWFFIPAFFPDIPVSQQTTFCQPRYLRISKYSPYEDGRYAMNWDEIRKVAEHHEICCHTGTHFFMRPDTDDATLRYEIIESKERLEHEIGRKVDVFCWNKGEEVNRVRRALPYLQEAGYRYVISNLKFERIR